MTTTQPSLQDIMDEELAKQVAESEYSSYPDEFAELQGVLTPEEIAMALSLQEIESSKKSQNHKVTQKDVISQLNFQVGSRNNRNNKKKSDRNKIETNNIKNVDILDDKDINDVTPNNDDDDNDEIQEFLDNSSSDSDELLWDSILKEAGPRPTKHNHIVNSIDKAKYVEEKFDNAGNMDGILLPNNAYKDLVKHYKNSQVKGVAAHKKVDKDRYSTFSEVLDNETINILFSWEGLGILDGMTGIISTGKEASVFYGSGHIEEISGDLHYAIKIHKTVLTDFTNRKDYITGDFRYSHTKINNITTRKLIKLWTRKEFCNLLRIFNNGIRCPRPFLIGKHVILMEFIGDNGIAAPLLREAPLSKVQVISCYKQSIQLLKELYEKAKLIHGDFSEYNLIFYRGHLYVIDVGQSVEITHDNSEMLLSRDCTNISNFFKDRIDAIRMLTIDEMMNYIRTKEITQTPTEYINQLRGLNDVDEDLI